MYIRQLCYKSANDSEDLDDYLFDNNDTCVDSHPLPDNCQNEILGVECIYKCFAQRYNECPAFFVGSLQAACEEAFGSPMINEVRFDCQYLVNNYIVWPWDITYESNKNKLAEIWGQVFPFEAFIDYSINKYPMLIGVMRMCVEEDEMGVLNDDYQFKVLVQGDESIRTHQRITRESLQDELVIFKEECDVNEQALVGFLYRYLCALRLALS
ncbi:hypothetical protein I4U23_022999 [Adineta vaga]|nr:hypothetical protein I4U23_022999 [Adineta vaga]